MSRRTRRVRHVVAAVAATTLWLCGLGLLVALWQYGAQLEAHPAPARIDTAAAPIPSTIYSARGFEIGGLERGAREWTPLHEVSPALVQALLASEDRRFFRHRGYDARGFARAMMANLRAGAVREGGSTLSQQVAKSWIGHERTWRRKVAELAMARQIEARFSKGEILESWLNRSYFGGGATGIRAAARLFYGVEPADLTLAQASAIVAAVPAPSVLHPGRESTAAEERRVHVLGALRAAGMAPEAALAAAAERAPPVGAGSRPHARPGLVRAVDKELAAAGVSDARYGGRHVFSALDLVRQSVAEDAVRRGVGALDRRQGLREHAAAVPEGRFNEAMAALDGQGGGVRLALVLSTGGDALVVYDGRRRTLGTEAWSWAGPWRADAEEHDARIDAPTPFARGDLVFIRDGQVVQRPRVEAAYGSVELAGGGIEALIGGIDGERSHFNRYVSGCRQPGSTFKPILYSAALDRGFSAATMLRDGPDRVVLGPQEGWSPRNADGRFDGHVTLRDAFARSRNLPAIQVIAAIGPEAVVERARELGITTSMTPVTPLALGASCVRPAELTEALAVFAIGGRRLTPTLVRSARGRDEAVWTAAAVSDPNTGAAGRAAALLRASRTGRRRAVSEQNASQVAALMRDVVRAGTGSSLRDIGWELSGKTGTTNAYDAWFLGISGREISTLWIGSDRNTRPLGRLESGSRLALPIWRDAALAPVPPIGLDAPVPPGLEAVLIDRNTGLVSPDGASAYEVILPPTTSPRREAPTHERRTLDRLDRAGSNF